MDYSLRELECFIAVAEERSFTRAAKRLNLAQPPLSRHVRALEDKIGAALFTREPRRIALTPAGNVFYEETRNIPRRLTRAGEAAKRRALGETARLRLGFVSAVMNDGLVRAFRIFRDTHPEIQIMLHDLPPDDQLAAIADGRLDGGFVGIEPAGRPAGIRFIPWQREALVALVPRAHPLAGRGHVSMAGLSAESFVAVSGESASAFAEHVRGLCDAAGFRPRVVLQSPRAQAVALMVAAGSGIAILPATVASLMGDAVSPLVLENTPEISHVFACRDRVSLEPLDHLIRLLDTQSGPG